MMVLRDVPDSSYDSGVANVRFVLSHDAESVLVSLRRNWMGEFLDLCVLHCARSGALTHLGHHNGHND